MDRLSSTPWHRHPTTVGGTVMAHRDTLTHDRNKSPKIIRHRRTATVSKRARKKRDRKKNASNHGKRPNS
jgi:hypothetical protein